MQLAALRLKSSREELARCTMEFENGLSVTRSQ
jgi:hypothetical protein